MASPENGRVAEVIDLNRYKATRNNRVASSMPEVREYSDMTRFDPNVERIAFGGNGEMAQLLIEKGFVTEGKFLAQYCSDHAGKDVESDVIRKDVGDYVKKCSNELFILFQHAERLRKTSKVETEAFFTRYNV